MTTETVTSPLADIHDETTAGNYFVSNYPPYSYWSHDNAGEAFAALEREPRPDTVLGLYTHIPFCRKRCHFCYFKVYTDKNAAAIAEYVDAVIRELTMYMAKPFIGGRKPRFVYFGGGTPSYLSTTQLLSLTDQMKALLPWDDVEEVTFECEPGTLTEKKIEVIKQIGVTRLSLGIENFDDHILNINGRAHETKEIYRAYDFARRMEFHQINIDLIAGMLEETPENWRNCVAKTLELQPDSVTIYQMEVPYNTGIYKQMKAEGKLTAPVASWSTKRGWVKYAFSELEKNGYTVTSAYTAVKDPAKTSFVYRDQLWTGADLLGIGVSSFGHINGTHFQNETNIVPYVEKVNKGEFPITRALTPTREDLLIRELILQMKLGGVEAEYFRQKFDVDILERFAAPLHTLQEGGFASIAGDRVELNRDGLMLVDRLVHEFFLPQHRSDRLV